MATQAAEAQNIDAEIAAAAAATEALARQYFGDAAYLRLDTHEDHETGEEKTVFEVHYCFPDAENDFDRLVALHRAVMDAWVRSMTRDLLTQIIFMAIPTDAD
ncbi:MAG TPA: hypothetical protein VEX86_25765 [Longimicrobium sp.]|nr:hypothetical protein [Longimicrobium sp.]